ncbi:hypothetical protein ES703_19341 [subsurface metagenome]
MSKKDKKIKYKPGKKPFTYWRPPKAENPERYRDPETDVIIEIDRRNKHKTIIIEGPAPAPGQHLAFAVPSFPYSEISKPIDDIDTDKLEKLEDK